MDNKMYQDEFEQFLQEEVKQHRMYPSDHIWKNIRTEIHGYTAWPALTFISLFVITALTISTLLIHHPDKPVSKLPGRSITNTVAVHQRIPVVAPAVAAEDDYFQQIAPEQITAETFSNRNEISAVLISTESSSGIDAFIERPLLTEIIPGTYIPTGKVVIKELPATTKPEIRNTLLAAVVPENAENRLYETNKSIGSKIANVPVFAEQATTGDVHASADDFLKDFSPVIYSGPQKRNSKFGFQFYITPSTSYRKLSDAKVKEIIQPATAAAASPSQNIPLSPNYAADVNNVVRHKPAMGLELGFAFLYNISGKLKFKTGVQLNIRQYYIETFQSTNDLSSLSLINNRGIETISFYSPYNNNTGYKKTRLDNKVYQVSVPIGIQWEIIQGKHFGISTEASIQPTLTLNNNTYLLSTDYQHYADGNNLMRKWNINSSAGLNISYKSGSVTWQLGPQVRYQHLPTYSNVYPIKEYLMDYGVRLGFTKQIN
ncbi:MAG: hypothetical protein Q8L07_00905 [Sediminibacterium sp.]|nr:hypothetical protein [Sediminibacterium sp.]MDP1810614.1 hypothetical protein [Sediminibacterium sp.]MDP3128604.1 hypothetical protein [Sediminibacterium sp.]